MRDQEEFSVDQNFVIEFAAVKVTPIKCVITTADDELLQNFCYHRISSCVPPSRPACSRGTPTFSSDGSLVFFAEVIRF